MTNKLEQSIRIYMKDSDGNLHDAKEDFLVSDFCGAVPRVGEFIVSRWLRDSKEESRIWSNRNVYNVEAVYYRDEKRNPGIGDSWVMLVVRDRPMTEQEWGLL